MASLLLLLHAALIGYTLLIFFGLWTEFERCGRTPPPRTCATGVNYYSWGDFAPVALAGTALGFLLDTVLVIHRTIKSKLAFVVPLLFCIAQTLLIVATIIYFDRIGSS